MSAEKIEFRMNKTREIAEMSIKRDGIDSSINFKDMDGKIKVYFGENRLEITKKNNYYHFNAK